jgi:hypothetical protein
MLKGRLPGTGRRGDVRTFLGHERYQHVECDGYCQRREDALREVLSQYDIIGTRARLKADDQRLLVLSQSYNVVVVLIASIMPGNHALPSRMRNVFV